MELCGDIPKCKETTSQCLAVPDLDIGSGTAVPVPLQPIIPAPEEAPAPAPAEGTRISLKPPNGKGLPQKKKGTIDDINEMHLSVLQKESLKLDLEIENVLLKKKEITLRIQELEARNDSNLNLFSC